MSLAPKQIPSSENESRRRVPANSVTGQTDEVGLSLQQCLAAAVERHRAGELDRAETLYRQVLQIDPQHADALHLLGVTAHQQNDHETAVDCIRRAISINPCAAAFHCNLGTAQQALGEIENAVNCFREAIRINPRYADAHYNLGNALKDISHFDDAKTAYRRTLDLVPNHAEALNNLGAVLHCQGEWSAARGHLERALAVKPDFPGAHTNLGNVHHDRGQIQEAIACYERALAVDSGYAEARFNRALAWIRSGDFGRGWAEYEWRWKQNVQPRNFPRPLWDGLPLGKRRLLVYAEQGIGDEIMFASCLPDLIAQHRHCLIECDPRLVGLFARSFPTVPVTARPIDADLHNPLWETLDVQIALGSLPRLFRNSLEAFPKQTGGSRRTSPPRDLDRCRHTSPPREQGTQELLAGASGMCRTYFRTNQNGYLQPDPDRLEHWQRRYEQLGPGLKIGISWRGGGEEHVRRQRSTQLQQWRPILTLPQADFVNLQYGDCREDLNQLQKSTGLIVHDWPDVDRFSDLETLAAQIAALDLVISVDNATVHMAGALGVNVWTLLPFAADWRWLLDCDESPWYRSMRLFRPRTPDAWDDLLNRVASKARQWQPAGQQQEPAIRQNHDQV